MNHLIDEKQRSQALIWYSVLGFSFEEIADHYGISIEQICFELEAERTRRYSAGKSPEPVPVRQHPMERQRTHADVLMECVTALQGIVEACDNRRERHAVNLSRHIACQALLKAGILA